MKKPPRPTKPKSPSKFWQSVKHLVATPKGVVALILSGIIAYSPSLVQLIIGAIIWSPTLIASGVATFWVLAQPLIPMWLIIPAIAVLLRKTLLKDKDMLK